MLNKRLVQLTAASLINGSDFDYDFALVVKESELVVNNNLEHDDERNVNNWNFFLYTSLFYTRTLTSYLRTRCAQGKFTAVACL